MVTSSGIDLDGWHRGSHRRGRRVHRALADAVRGVLGGAHAGKGS
jgi:hypothetical protein